MMNTVLDSVVTRLQKQFNGKQAVRGAGRRRQNRRPTAAKKPAPEPPTARPPEWQVVEQIQQLLASQDNQDSHQGSAALAELLEQVPGEMLLTILSENVKTGFLPPDGMGRVLDALPLQRVTQLGRLLARQVDQQRALSLTLSLLLAERLMSLDTLNFRIGDEQLAQMVPKLFGELDNSLGWDLICRIAQLIEGENKADAVSWLLTTLGPRRSADIVSHRFSDHELGVYWILLPASVKQELNGRGRGPVRPRHDARHAARESARRQRTSARAEAGWRPRQGRSWYRRPDPAPRSSLQRAMDVMRRRFGFHEAMTYHQARQQYWNLALDLHPDRTGGDPAAAERLQDLNNAWASARASFQATSARQTSVAAAL